MTNPTSPILENPEKAAMAQEALQTRQTATETIGQGSHDSALRDFFLEELKDIYWAEQHILVTLPRMKAAATSERLKAAFDDHMVVTQQHATRLEQAFQLMGAQPEAKKCEAIAGITEEGEGIIAETQEGTATRDVGLVLAAQKVEHYEIATYGGLHQLALTLGLREVAGLLHTTLIEEKQTDALLTLIAESGVNYGAKMEG